MSLLLCILCPVSLSMLLCRSEQESFTYRVDQTPLILPLRTWCIRSPNCISEGKDNHKFIVCKACSLSLSLNNGWAVESIKAKMYSDCDYDSLFGTWFLLRDSVGAYSSDCTGWLAIPSLIPWFPFWDHFSHSPTSTTWPVSICAPKLHSQGAALLSWISILDCMVNSGLESGLQFLFYLFL